MSDPHQSQDDGLSSGVFTALVTLIDRLDDEHMAANGVITWGAPVPSFGDLSKCHVATLGLNPSNREFVDDQGIELQGGVRRFHTLTSLGISSWEQVQSRHLTLILNSCRQYFEANPYDRWFKKLDFILAGAGASFYAGSRKAAHLDLIPYATSKKWTDLTTKQRTFLLAIGADILGHLLRESPINVLILNGKSVVDNFQDVAGVTLDRSRMDAWSLQRRMKADVAGFGYIGTVCSIGGVDLSREVAVIGYNHNIQSSFGVTREAVLAIRNWIQRSLPEVNA